MVGWDYSIFFLALSLAIGFILVCYWLPEIKYRKYPDGVEKHGLVNEFRKITAQILGGAAIVLAFSWSYMRESESLRLSIISQNDNIFLEIGKISSQNSSVSTTYSAFLFDRLAKSSEYKPKVLLSLLSLVPRIKVRNGTFTSSEISRVEPSVSAVVYALGNNDWSDVAGINLDMSYSLLSGASFLKMKGLRKGNFDSAIILATNFESADLTGASFRGVKGADWEAYSGFRGQYWSDDILKRPGWENERFEFITNFRWATLKRADFRGSSLTGATFQGADLEGANFGGANISRVDFSEANLDKASFVGACADMSPLFSAGQPPIHLEACLH